MFSLLSIYAIQKAGRFLLRYEVNAYICCELVICPAPCYADVIATAPTCLSLWRFPVTSRSTTTLSTYRSNNSPRLSSELMGSFPKPTATPYTSSVPHLV